MTLFSVGLAYALAFPFATVRYAALRKAELEAATQPADGSGESQQRPDGA
jgi:hypothetical protein